MFLGKFSIFLTGIYAVYHIVDAFLYFLEFVGCEISMLACLLQYILPQQYETLLHGLLMFQQTGQQYCTEIFLHLDGFGYGEYIFVVGEM